MLVSAHIQVSDFVQWMNAKCELSIALYRTRFIATQLTYFLAIWQHTVQHRQLLNYFELHLIRVNWIARAVHRGDCLVRNNLKLWSFSEKRERKNKSTHIHINWNYCNNSHGACTNSRQSLFLRFILHCLFLCFGFVSLFCCSCYCLSFFAHFIPFK